MGGGETFEHEPSSNGGSTRTQQIAGMVELIAEAVARATAGAFATPVQVVKIIDRKEVQIVTTPAQLMSDLTDALKDAADIIEEANDLNREMLGDDEEGEEEDEDEEDEVEDLRAHKRKKARR